MIDLHMHSVFSDGSLTPEELIQEAVKMKVTAVSLTDHDTMSGVPRFLAAARDAGLQAIPGVEISTDYNGRGMHILGYGMDMNNADLIANLQWIREGREARNEEKCRRREEKRRKWEEQGGSEGV